jgi:hypothetical protein
MYLRSALLRCTRHRRRRHKPIERPNKSQLMADERARRQPLPAAGAGIARGARALEHSANYAAAAGGGQSQPAALTCSIPLTSRSRGATAHNF